MREKEIKKRNRERKKERIDLPFSVERPELRRVESRVERVVRDARQLETSWIFEETNINYYCHFRC